jgi:anti-sigma28 factor (negative regulator of flagellin synthesis)
MGHSDKGDPPVPLPAASDNAEDGTRQRSEREVKPSDNVAPDAERLKKINDLKKAVADGTYHVSAEEVARKVLEHILEPKD